MRKNVKHVKDNGLFAIHIRKHFYLNYGYLN